MLDILSLPKTIVNWVADTGEEVFSEVFDFLDKDDKDDKDRGFLSSFIEIGAKKAVGMFDEEREMPEHLKQRTPEIARVASPRTTRVSSTGVQNREIRAAVERAFRRQNANSDFQRLINDAIVERNLRTGRRTMGLESPRLPQAQVAPMATPKKVSETEIQ